MWVETYYCFIGDTNRLAEILMQLLDAFLQKSFTLHEHTMFPVLGSNLPPYRNKLISWTGGGQIHLWASYLPNYS